jgi:N-acetylglutamate synthase-like GNAT family acetyltransferase
MIESAATSHQPSFYLRPANANDRSQLHALTRQLHQSAIAQPVWPAWWVGFSLTLLLVIVWQAPHLFIAALVSSSPIWISILLALLIAQREQQKQYDRYWVVEHHQQLIGCGRIDQHPQHAEIYDLFVRPEWRTQGIGHRIMTQLIAQTETPIYLASLPAAVNFYQRLGFTAIAPTELPPLLANRLSLHSPRYRRVGLQPMVLMATHPA